MSISITIIKNEFLKLTMGYAYNHLATIVTGAFAIVLTGLWIPMVDFAPLLNFIFIMAVPITWFLVLTCWLAQKSADWTTNHSHTHENHQKKSLSSTQTVQVELSTELNDLKSSVEVKDSEIERLNQEISNLKTLVQIESLKAELANLKILSSKRK